MQSTNQKISGSLKDATKEINRNFKLNLNKNEKADFRTYNRTTNYKNL